MTTQDGLVLEICPRVHSVELQVAGDLDLAGAWRLVAAVAWLRHRYHRMIVIDTRQLGFVDLTGYRALMGVLRHDDGTADPQAVHVVGDVVARLQGRLAAVRHDQPSGRAHGRRRDRRARTARSAEHPSGLRRPTAPDRLDQAGPAASGTITR